MHTYACRHIWEYFERCLSGRGFPWHGLSTHKSWHKVTQTMAKVCPNMSRLRILEHSMTAAIPLDLTQEKNMKDFAKMVWNSAFLCLECRIHKYSQSLNWRLRPKAVGVGVYVSYIIIRPHDSSRFFWLVAVPGFDCFYPIFGRGPLAGSPQCGRLRCHH